MCIVSSSVTIVMIVSVTFSQQVIRPYIPQRSPVLGKHIYEMVLNEFLNTDTKVGMECFYNDHHYYGK